MHTYNQTKGSRTEAAILRWVRTGHKETDPSGLTSPMALPRSLSRIRQHLLDLPELFGCTCQSTNLEGIPVRWGEGESIDGPPIDRAP